MRRTHQSQALGGRHFVSRLGPGRSRATILRHQKSCRASRRVQHEHGSSGTLRAVSDDANEFTDVALDYETFTTSSGTVEAVEEAGSEASQA